MKWFARVTGFLFIVFFLVSMIPGRLQELLPDKEPGITGYLLSGTPILLGYLLSWRKPYAGGLLMVLGAVFLAAFFLFQGSVNMSMLYGIPPLLAGLAYIALSDRVLL
jgi:hypothetical protein